MIQLQTQAQIAETAEMQAITILKTHQAIMKETALTTMKETIQTTMKKITLIIMKEIVPITMKEIILIMTNKDKDILLLNCINSM